MQTVIVKPGDLQYALEMLTPHLEDHDILEIGEPVAIEGVKGKSMVTVTGTSQTIHSFVMSLALSTRYPEVEDPTLFDMRTFMDRYMELIRQAYVVDGYAPQFEVVVDSE